MPVIVWPAKFAGSNCASTNTCSVPWLHRRGSASAALPGSCEHTCGTTADVWAGTRAGAHASRNATAAAAVFVIIGIDPREPPMPSAHGGRRPKPHRASLRARNPAQDTPRRKHGAEKRKGPALSPGPSGVVRKLDSPRFPVLLPLSTRACGRLLSSCVGDEQRVVAPHHPHARAWPR